jgi:hypothetical protein
MPRNPRSVEGPLKIAIFLLKGREEKVRGEERGREGREERKGAFSDLFVYGY